MEILYTVEPQTLLGHIKVISEVTWLANDVRESGSWCMWELDT